jgi:hypothetical protein
VLRGERGLTEFDLVFCWVDWLLGLFLSSGVIFSSGLVFSSDLVFFFFSL